MVKIFLFETDQKPLTSMLTCSPTEVIPRLQRLVMGTSPYGFDEKYIEGSTDQLVDCLLWLGPNSDHIGSPQLQVNAPTSQPHATAGRLGLLRQATMKDDKLTQLKHVVQQGMLGAIQEVVIRYNHTGLSRGIGDGLLFKVQEV